MQGPGRFRAAADLSYYLGMAERHANQLEVLLTHGLDTSDTLVMLASDIAKATEALTAYRDAAMLRNKEGMHDRPQ